MSTLTAALMLPAGACVQPDPYFVEDYKSIQNAVGGNFDVVRTDLGHEGVSLVGYVHDEGTLLGLEYNYIATALFKQNIYGDCVVVWGLDESGIYDGDNHDIPEFMVDFLCEDLMETVAEAYNLSVYTALSFEYAEEYGLVPTEELEMLKLTMIDNMSRGVSNEANMKRVSEIIRMVADHMETNPDLDDSEED